MPVLSWERESQLFANELGTLSYSNHYVTFPFLHCVEQSTQPEVLVISSKPYKGLLDHKTDTLPHFVVNIPGINPPNLTNNLGLEIIQQISEAALSAVQLQCGREYVFPIKKRVLDPPLKSIDKLRQTTSTLSKVSVSLIMYYSIMLCLIIIFFKAVILTHIFMKKCYLETAFVSTWQVLLM